MTVGMSSPGGKSVNKVYFAGGLCISLGNTHWVNGPGELLHDGGRYPGCLLASALRGPPAVEGSMGQSSHLD